MKHRPILVMALVVLATVLPAAGAAANGAVVIPFDKQFVSGSDPFQWSGDAGDGTIFTTLGDVNVTGNVWHLAFDSWLVEETGTTCDSFSADLVGILNLTNGRVSMNGTVTEGDCEGARIHVQARLDLVDFSSQGTMLITP